MAVLDLATFLEALAATDEQIGEGWLGPGLGHQDLRGEIWLAARSGWFLAEVYQFAENEGIKTVQDLRGFFTSMEAARERGPSVAAAWEASLCEPAFDIKMLIAATRGAGGDS
eukprot:6613331-Heterocapsa_arctica.AAC.1